MDPSRLVDRLVEEIALDGIHGMQSRRLWQVCEKECGYPIDEALQNAIWKWIASNPAISVREGTLFATEELQWLTLTGAPKSDNVVGNLTFELLCIIAHNREYGISTIEASRALGQDLRSLFGRVQTLVNLGIVRRFPVIEQGSSTNRMVFHSYVGPRTASTLDDTGVDKQAIAANIAQFCKSGVQGIRSTREIVREIGKTLDRVKPKRRRPTIMGSLRFLMALGAVRRVTMVHPEFPDTQLSCVEFIKDYSVEQQGNQNDLVVTGDSIVSGPLPLGGGNANTEDEDAELDDEDGDEDDDEDEEGSNSNSVIKPELLDPHLLRASEERTLQVQANTITPLPNQIYDFVQLRGEKGVSAMELTRSLTGKAYRKAFGKYLDALTAATPGRAKELEHLSLVKGVDFNRRVKFYRYFTKIAYSKLAKPPEHWGQFTTSSTKLPENSLVNLDLTTAKPLPGICSIVKLHGGSLRAVFHGDKEVEGEVVLKTGPTDASSSNNNHSSVAADGTPKRKRGRPRKNEPKVVKQSVAPSPRSQEQQQQNEQPPSSTGVPVASRHWHGGKPTSESNYTTSCWLQPIFTGKQEPPSSAQAAEPNDTKPDTADATSSVGSLAHQQRAEALIKIVQSNGGAVSGGAPLMDKFNEALAGKYSIDRRTINNVVDKLVKEGKLQKIYTSVPTNSGKHILKYLIYDPSVILSPDTHPRIASVKAELLEGNRERHVQATRAAMDAARDALHKLPQREMTEAHVLAFGPKFMQPAPNRILTTQSGKSRGTAREKTKFGPSAAEVLGVNKDGTLQSRVKRPARRPEACSGVPTLTSKHTPAAIATATTSAAAVGKTDTSAHPLHGKGSVGKDEISIKPVASPTKPKVNVDLDRLARAVIIYRSLFAFSGSGVDWKAVATSLGPGVTASEARKHWNDARSFLAKQEPSIRASDIVFKKSEQFETLFLTAYKKNVVAWSLDQDARTTLPQLITWWQEAEVNNLLEKLNSSFSPDDHSAAATDDGGAAKRLSELALKDRKLQHADVDPFVSLQSQVSIVNAEKLLTSSVFGAPIGRSFIQSPKLTNNEMRLRAVIAADQGPSYSPERAARELNGLTNAETEVAKAGLELKRVIQWGENDLGKVPTGRPFVLSEQVLNALTVSKLDPSVPSKLVENMGVLTTCSDTITVPPTVDESDMICLLELCTFGLHNKSIKLHRLGEKFGLLSSDYKSRGIDKQEFECELKCEIVDHEENEEGSAPVSTGFCVPPPRSNNHHRPWLWETRYLSSRIIWFKVAFKLLATIHFRPGITVDAVALALRNALEYDETAAAISALAESGALHQRQTGLFAAANWFEYLV